MLERTVIVTAKDGLHARPAARFVQRASTSSAAVTLRKDGGDPIDAKSMLSVLALGVREGDQVILAGEDCAGQLLDELAALLSPQAEAT